MNANSFDTVYKQIRILRDKIIDDKLKYISIDDEQNNTSVGYSCWLKRLDNSSLGPTNQISIELL